MSKYEELGRQIGAICDTKDNAYGGSFDKAGEFLRLLYPNGVPLSKYDDALCIVRVWDKLMRVATDRDALGESPWADICGYALLALNRVNEQHAKAIS